MNEPTPTPAITNEIPAKKKRNLLLPIAGAIIAIAVGGFVASRAGLDKALVKQQVDDFIVQMKEKGRASGRELNLTYTELDVEGSFTNKRVVMRNPVLTTQPLERAPVVAGATKVVDALRFTTPALEIYPSVSSVTIKAREQIDVASQDAPEKSLLKVKSNVAQEVTVAQKKIGEVTYSDVEYRVPSQIEFTYLKEEQTQGAEEQTPTVVPVYQTMGLALAQGGKITSSIAEDESDLGSASVDLRDIVVTPHAAPEGTAKIAEITGKWSNALNEKKLNVVTALMKVGPMTSDNAAFPYLPLKLDVDATYEGSLQKNAGAAASVPPAETLMVLRNFELSTKDASLKATANFTANATDVMPVGIANLSLSNVPFVLGELRKMKLLNEASEPLVVALLTKITGTPVEQLKDVVIPIERVRGGAFKVGASTFEELVAVFLQQAMQQRSGEVVPAPAAPADGSAPVVPAAPALDKSSEMNAPLVPTLPPADKPKLAPIEIPDLSVRG